MPKRKKANSVMTMLADVSNPIEQRRDILRMVAHDASPPAEEALDTAARRVPPKRVAGLHFDRLDVWWRLGRRFVGTIRAE